ncbi:hypothetical protein PF586_04000 [Lactobacillus delbrueckii]|uniref:Cyclic nucleotide phosphodiesterase C-terminal domain-containing protein n=1 Tax=Lactobacillus delbrueckii TaxID=1584 RepID=A0AAW5YVK1_9LACO|nr:hypothetical protein [Lactobacillus delbrueckii]MDA3767640.1 hypothetical protein [Lactobacillus delbrueckii]
MLDSNLYSSQFSYTHPMTSGAIDDGERRWLSQELVEAKRLGQDVMHHNLYSHNSVVHDGFKLNNAGEIVQLLSQYPVRCAFSGHIHAQHIMFGWVPVPEVVSSCFAESDQGYGIVELTANSLSYRHHAFDIDNFLTAEEKKLPPFADFHAYLKEVFDKSNNLLLLKGAAKDLPEAAEMLKKMHWGFFTGQSYKSEAEIAAIYESSAYRTLLAAMPSMKSYISSLYESTQSSQKLYLTW